jgi:hypothetical protein
MMITDLQKRIAEVLGVSSSEKELAYDIIISKIADNLEVDITLKVPRIGFFQLREDESQNKGSLIFTPFSEDITKSSRTLYLTIDVPGRTKKNVDNDSDVFSIGVGKPLVPLSNDSNPQAESETSYAILKRSIEERVNEIITESDYLPNFNIWDDYYEGLGTNEKENESQSQLLELTSDLEFKEDIIAEDITNNLLESEAPKEFESVASQDLILTPTDLLNDYKPLEKDHPKEELVNNSSSVLNELPIDQSFDEPVDNILNSSEDLNELLKGYDDSKIPESDFEKIKESVSKDVENIQSDTLPSEKIEERFEEIEVDEDEETYLGLKKSVIENIDWNWGDELKEEFGSSTNEKKRPVLEFEEESEELNFEDETATEIFKQTNPIASHLFEQLESSIKKELEESETGDNYIEYSPPPPRYEFIEDRSETEYQQSPQITSRVPTGPTYEQEYQNNLRNKDNYFSRNFIWIFASFVIATSLIVYFLMSNTSDSQANLTEGNIPTDSFQNEQMQTSLPVDSNIIIEEDENNFPRVPAVPITDKDGASNISPAKLPAQQPVVESARTNLSGDLNKTPVTDTRIGKTVYYDGTNYNVQVSSWRNKAKAELEVKRLRNLGLNAFLFEAYLPQKGGTWYRVRVGNFKSKEEAEVFESKNNL